MTTKPKKLISARKTQSERYLVKFTFTINGRISSCRLEPEMLDALREIAERSGCTPDNIVARCKKQRSLTAAIRLYIMEYFRSAAIEAGHAAAGHGVRRRITK